MHGTRWLAIVPFLALIVGPFFVNRVSPFVAGMPLLLAWIVGSILVTVVVMVALIVSLGWWRQAERESKRADHERQQHAPRVYGSASVADRDRAVLLLARSAEGTAAAD